MIARRIAKRTGQPDRRQSRNRPRKSPEERATSARKRDELYSRTVAVPIDVLAALEPAAEARGVHVNMLVRALLAEIADEGLVDDILEGGE